MYYRIKTSYLVETFPEFLENDDDDESYEAANLSVMSSNVSIHMKELLDPKTPLPTINDDYKQVTSQLTTQNLREFDAADHLSSNDTAWNDKINKPKPIQETKIQEK